MSHELVHILRKKQVQVDCKQSFILIQILFLFLDTYIQIYYISQRGITKTI